MATNSSERQPGKLKAVVLARKVANHTLVVTANDKIFIPKYQKLTDKIIDSAVSIATASWAANNITVSNKQDWMERARLQKASIAQCRVLLGLIEIARPQFHLRLNKVRYWGKLIVEAKAYLIAWHKSDNLRYNKMP